MSGFFSIDNPLEFHSSDVSDINHYEPGMDCAGLCYDCDKGSYCWLSCCADDVVDAPMDVL